MFIKKVLLYLSAFIPLYILLSLKIIIQIINKNLSFNILNTLMLCLLFILTVMGAIGVALSIKKGPRNKINIISATNITEKHFLGYFSLFVLFALSFDIELICMFVIFLFILLFIGIVYIRNNLFYINPLLNLIGFSFYEVTYKLLDAEEAQTSTMFFYGKISCNKVYFAQLNNYNFNLISD